MSKKYLVVALAATLVLQNAALAQVPVIDAATLTQATTTAANTAAIMASNQQILTTVQKTLTAVTGNRSTSALSSIALGSFSMSSIPSLSSLLGGGNFDEWRADAEHKRDRHPHCQCVLQLGGA